MDLVGAQLCDVITGATGGFIDLSVWAANLRQDATDAVNGAAQAQVQANAAQAHSNAVATAVTTGTGNTPSTTPSDVQAAVAQTTADANAAAALAAQNEANLVASTASTTLTLATKADLASVPHNVPGWHSLNPLEDVSFARSEIIQGYSVQISAGSFGGATTITLTDNAGNVENVYYATIRTEPSFAPASGVLQIVFVNATRDRVYNTVGLVARTNSGSPAALYVGISKMDLTSGVPNGNITRLYTSGNLSGSITSALSDVRDNLSFDIAASQGDWFAVEILQIVSGGQSLNNIACKVGVAITAVAGQNPARPVMTLSGQSAIPTSITKASMDQSSVTTPWVCLGQQTATTKADYVDLLDRSNSPNLGSNWAPYWFHIGISGNAAAIPGLPNPGGFNTNDQVGGQLYTSQLTTDSQAVIATFGAPATAGAMYTTPQPTTIVLRSNSNMTAYVGAAITGTDIKIITPSTTLASVANTNNSGDVVEIHCAANVFTVYINGVAKLTYTDSSNVLPLGASYRFCGFVMHTWAYGADFVHAQQYHQTAPILQIEIKDL